MSRPSKKRIILLVLTAVVAAAIPCSGENRDAFKKDREDMVTRQIASRGVGDPRVLDSMRTTPRHLFVPENLIGQAYNDTPLPIGEGQTISQPYIVAFMTEKLGLEGGEKVLEIGTGSGYQAAVLSLVASEVYTIEIKRVLYERTKKKLEELGYDTIRTRFGDGYHGWEEAAPFDCIMITAAVNHVPPPLLTQLKDGGRIILPLGEPFDYFGQKLVVITREGDEFFLRELLGVRFVPMTGRAQDNGH